MDGSFVIPKISATVKRGITPTEAPISPKRRWGRLNAGAVTAYWRLSTRSVVNLVWSQVYHTERPPYLSAARSRDAARRARLSAKAGPCIGLQQLIVTCSCLP